MLLTQNPASESALTMPSGRVPTWQESFVPNTQDLNTAMLWRKCKSRPELEPSLITAWFCFLQICTFEYWSKLVILPSTGSPPAATCSPSLLKSPLFVPAFVAVTSKYLKVTLEARVWSDCVGPHLWVAPWGRQWNFTGVQVFECMKLFPEPASPVLPH